MLLVFLWTQPIIRVMMVATGMVSLLKPEIRSLKLEVPKIGEWDSQHRCDWNGTLIGSKRMNFKRCKTLPIHTFRRVVSAFPVRSDPRSEELDADALQSRRRGGV